MAQLDDGGITSTEGRLEAREQGGEKLRKEARRSPPSERSRTGQGGHPWAAEGEVAVLTITPSIHGSPRDET